MLSQVKKGAIPMRSPLRSPLRSPQVRLKSHEIALRSQGDRIFIYSDFGGDRRDRISEYERVVRTRAHALSRQHTHAGAIAGAGRMRGRVTFGPMRSPLSLRP
jgi:hypothetical protein